jgi:hypothetical protein
MDRRVEESVFEFDSERKGYRHNTKKRKEKDTEEKIITTIVEA